MTAVTARGDVLDRLQEQSSRIRQLGVRRLGLFGSFANGSPGPQSDVDILVEFEPGAKSFDGFMDLAFLLEETLERTVELITTEALSPHLGPKILAEVQDVPLGP
jgi:predicted nucleotidyltransferase